MFRQYWPNWLRESETSFHPPCREIEGSSQEIVLDDPPPPEAVTTNADRSMHSAPEDAWTARSCGPSGADASMAIGSVRCVPLPSTVAEPSWMPSSALPSLLKTATEPAANPEPAIVTFRDWPCAPEPGVTPVIAQVGGCAVLHVP